MPPCSSYRPACQAEYDVGGNLVKIFSKFAQAFVAGPNHGICAKLLQGCLCFVLHAMVAACASRALDVGTQESQQKTS